MRREATPGLFVFHDHANISPPATWGPVGSWMYWAWSELNPSKGVYNWSVIDNYLAKAAAMGKPVAISVMPYTSPKDVTKADKTPPWVYTGGCEPWDDGAGGTYPAWGDYRWDREWAAFIAAFGAKYDGSEEVHSVWICTAHYGETNIDLPTGGSLDGHNPGQYFSNTLGGYAEAFPTTPLFMIATGPTNRLSLCQHAWELGVNVKFNGLVRDAKNQHGVKLMPPGPDGGLMDIAHEATERGLPTAWEHAYALTQPKEAYWAMLSGLANGMEVFDTEIVGLETIAAIPGLWAWMLDVMRAPRDRVAMWVARDTASPPPGNQYESGYPGPWVRGGIAVGADVGAPGSPLYASAPSSLTATLEGYGGIGYVEEFEAYVTLDGLPPGNYRIEIVTSSGEAWEMGEQVVAVDGRTYIDLPMGTTWVHRVVVTPTDEEPPPPPPDPPSIAELTAKVGELTEGLLAMIDVVNAQDEDIQALEQAIAVHLERIGRLDAKLAKMHEALE